MTAPNDWPPGAREAVAEEIQAHTSSIWADAYAATDAALAALAPWVAQIEAAAGGGAGFSVVSRSRGCITAATATSAGGISVIDEQKNPGGWPDPARPGVPENPERDGRHWIQTHPMMTSPISQSVWDWSAKKQAWWADENGTHLSPAQVERLLYLGPALLPAEVAAREAAAKEAGMREAVEAVQKRAWEIGRQECCGHGQSDGYGPPECCGQPDCWISDRDAAAAILAAIEKEPTT